MKFSLRAGTNSELGRLPPEQRDVLRRLEKREITADQAERELLRSIHAFEHSAEEVEEAAQPAGATHREHRTEDEIAREMIEQIAREIDEEKRR